MPYLLVALVAHEFGIKIFCIELSPLCGGPTGEVDTVGHIAHMVLLRIVSVPDGGEHLLAHPTVQLAHTVHFLAGVAGKNRHAEALVVVFRILAAHTDELIPGNTEHGGIAAHIFAEELLVEIVMSGRHRRMNGIERRCSHQFHGLVERHALAHIVAETLQVAQGGMSLVAVVNLLLDAQFLQGEHTTDTQQDFLLQTVLPVATVE